MGDNRKIGRNDPCPCGSGRKYKKCCLLKNEELRRGSIIPPEVQMQAMKRLRERQRQIIAWESEYGKVKPIIHTDFKGKKVVAVGSRVYFENTSKWRTFPDFLISYITSVLGRDWGLAELTKPLEERHQIMKWYDGMRRFQRQQKPGKNGIYDAIPNGPFAAYLFLAYDLYTLHHHMALQIKVVDRLKKLDQFQGARYELFAAATCIRAGFSIEYEEESDPKTKHPEFVGAHKDTGQKISVEAKSRHRPGVLGFRGQKMQEEVKAGVGRLFKEALDKPVKHPYVIFIDLNLPPSEGKIFEKPWFIEVRDTISDIAGDVKKSPDKFNLVVITNHPHHYGEEGEPDPAKDTLCIFSPRPAIAAQHPNTILAIYDAAMKYGHIPNFFPEN
jgi:hypothetical protein